MNNPHILLVSLETIRRDHLRCHGYHKDLAPHLDRLAREGVYCTDAIANCGWTLPQNITLHTGLYPLTHDLTLLRDQHPLSSSFTLLAEHLKKHGYRTFAGVNSSNPYSAHARYGFDRGFDEHNPGAAYNQHMEWTEEFTLTRFAENHTKAPCFVYIHVNDTHEPWDAPESWKSMWGNSYHNQYESDISYTDHYLGRILAGLKEMDIFENTLIVIAGDHGTEFWEHGFIEKKVNLYNEILHIPMIFHCPSLLPSGKALIGLSESAQVTPTIVDISGLPPISTAQGKSLLPRIQGKESGGLDHVCSFTRHEHQGQGGPVQFDHYSIHTQQYKFIRLELHAELEDLAHDWKYRIQAIAIRCQMSPDSLKPGSVMRELYDLKRDPGEGNNLISRENNIKIAKNLENKLDKWIKETVSARA